jgi:MYXO-CTERM domain-containing protein
MKNFIRSLSVLFAFLAPLVIVGHANATVVWTATFEKDKSGDPCSSNAPGAEFTPGINDTTRVDAEVLGDHVYTGSLACRITVHPTDTFGQYNQDRVDIQHQSTLTGEGKQSWLSGHYYMPADAMMRNEIGFYETKVSSSNVIDFWVQPKNPDGGTGTTLSFGVGFLGATVLWTGDFEIGKWHQIAVHVKWSQNASMGSVDFWLDGEQKVTNYAFKTKPDGNDLFFQTGLHRILPKNFTDTIYFDDFLEGDTEPDAQIAAPVQPGATPDGGAGAAGASGTAGTTGTSGAGGANGTAGAGGTTGSAGATGSAGNAGSAGATQTGTAGTTTTGSAGATTSGTAGSMTMGTAGHSGGSSGCALAATPDASRGAIVAMLALFGIVIVARRRR